MSGLQLWLNFLQSGLKNASICLHVTLTQVFVENTCINVSTKFVKSHYNKNLIVLHVVVAWLLRIGESLPRSFTVQSINLQKRNSTNISPTCSITYLFQTGLNK